jgi:hypothetical protein
MKTVGTILSISVLLAVVSPQDLAAADRMVVGEVFTNVE